MRRIPDWRLWNEKNYSDPSSNQYISCYYSSPYGNTFCVIRPNWCCLSSYSMCRQETLPTPKCVQYGSIYTPWEVKKIFWVAVVWSNVKMWKDIIMHTNSEVCEANCWEELVQPLNGIWNTFAFFNMTVSKCFTWIWQWKRLTGEEFT